MVREGGRELCFRLASRPVFRAPTAAPALMTAREGDRQTDGQSEKEKEGEREKEKESESER